MADATIESRLAFLESTARSLNKDSDSVNALLQRIEKRLVDANIGFEIWLPQPLSRSEAKKEAGAENSAFERRLGFARVFGGWCLAVKEVRTRFGYFQGNTDCPWSDEHLEKEPIPLEQAGREERITALRLMPALLEALEAKAKEAIQTIAEAKRLGY
jgi:hypothetical protein